MHRSSGRRAILVAAAMLLCLLADADVSDDGGTRGPGPTDAGGGFGGGSGTAADPYVIEDVWDLQNMKNDLKAHYVLENDIDAFPTVDWNFGTGFEPVGTAYTNFTGSLDGRNHTITGLRISRSSTELGMFGYLGKGGSVRNLWLTQFDFYGGYYVGGLAGQCDFGTISNVHADGSIITLAPFVGGLVGENSGTISNSSTDGRVSGSSTVVGGLVGRNYGTVSSSWSTAKVTGTESSVGGLMGSNHGTVSDSHSAGTVTGKEFVGGLVGSNYGTVSRCFATGIVDASHWTVGGLAGSNQGGTVEDSHASGNVTGEDYAGGLVGWNFFATVDRSYATGNASVVNNYAGGLIGDNLHGEVSDCHATGNAAGHSYVGGLVGNFTNGTLLSCWATGDAAGRYYVGGLVGYIQQSTAEDSYATGNVTGDGSIGGLVGYNQQSTVHSSYAAANVMGYLSVGGLVGYNWGTLSRCYAEGRVGGETDVGGLVGYLYAQTLSNCYATGGVAGYSSVGGLVGGLDYYGLVKTCYSTGKVRGELDVGGLVGFSWGGTVFSSFWDNQTSGLNVSAGGSGYCTEVLKTRALFMRASWDMDQIWCMIENITYPLLRWQDRAAPIADAGPDQTIDEGTLAAFDGSDSLDDLGIAEYEWTFEDEGPVVLYGDRPTYRFDHPGKFTVTLNVTDAVGGWHTDTIDVIVLDITPPIAFAGPDQTVDEDTWVTLDGSGSLDNVGVVNWTWAFRYGASLPDGEPYRLYGETAHFVFGPGIYEVSLTVRDAAGNSRSDSMNVTVNDVKPPFAEAGPDQVVDEGTLVTLDGSLSHDTGRIEDHAWTFRYDQEEISLHGERPSFYFDIPGGYVVSLRVTDAAGHVAIDFMRITVNDITPPVADAGPDLTVDEGALVTLDGSGSSDNVGVVNFTWRLEHVGDERLLYGVSPSLRFDVPGVYPVTLNVTDAAGHWREDIMTVTVKDTTPPVADAGPDLTVPVGSTVPLDGSLSADNVGITDHSWALFYDGGSRSLTGAVVLFTFDAAGAYEVVLTVTDAAANQGVDELVITVVDTGWVTGTVLDRDGRPVEGATVEVTTRNGTRCSATTAADGSFALEVHHGHFAWKVSKDGYRTMSGSSSVAPMGSTELELSGLPLNEEEAVSSTLLLAIRLVVVTALVVVGAALLQRRMRRGGGQEGA